MNSRKIARLLNENAMLPCDQHDPIRECDCRECAIHERNRLRVELGHLSQELLEWQSAYATDSMADVWRRRYWVAKRLLDDMRGAVSTAHEALRFAWGGEPIGSLEMEAMQKLGSALGGLAALDASEPKKP